MAQSVPNPDPGKRLTEEQKRAMELQSEVEHATGEQREDLAKSAQEKLPPEKP